MLAVRVGVDAGRPTNERTCSLSRVVVVTVDRRVCVVIAGGWVVFIFPRKVEWLLIYLVLVRVKICTYESGDMFLVWYQSSDRYLHFCAVLVDSVHL